jgi:hypothetical protein
LSDTDSFIMVRQKAVAKAEENYRASVALAKAIREAAETLAAEDESLGSENGGSQHPQSKRQAIAAARQAEKEALRLAEANLKAAVLKAMQDEVEAQKKARAESTPAAKDNPAAKTPEAGNTLTVPVVPPPMGIKGPRPIESELARLRESLMELVSVTSADESNSQAPHASAVETKAPPKAAEKAASILEKVVKVEAKAAPRLEDVVEAEADKEDAPGLVEVIKVGAASSLEKEDKAQPEAALHVEKAVKSKEAPAPEPVLQVDPQGRIKVSISRVATAKQLLEVESALRRWPGVRLIMSLGGGVNASYYVAAEDPSLLASHFLNLSIVENAFASNGGLSVILKTDAR